jgi:hypothetical protein
MGGDEVVRALLGTLLVACLVLGTSGSILAGTVMKVKLDRSYTLRVEQTEKPVPRVTVSLCYLDGEVLQVIIMNALASKKSMRQVDLDRSSAEKEYLLVFPDATSTYGALNGLVVYKLETWCFQFVPGDRFELVDRDQDGTFEIKLSGGRSRVLRLEQGALVPDR